MSADTPGGFVRSPLFPIALIVAVDVFGFTLVLPLLPFYAQSLGATPLVVGLLAAAFSICQFVAGPILGRLSDRHGRKRVLLVSQAGTLAGFLLMGFSHSLVLLFIARIIDGATAGNLSIAQAYISDVTKPEDRTRAFGLIGIAFGLGFMLGPAISGFLSTFGYQWPAFAAALLSATSILCTRFLLPDVPPHVETGAKRLGRIEQIVGYLRWPAPRQSLLQFFCFVLAFTTLIGGMAMFLERQYRYDAEHVGYVYAFAGLAGAAVQGGLLGRLVKRTGEARLAMFGFAAMTVAYVALGWTYELPWLLLCLAVGAFGSSVTRPSLTTLVTKSAGRDEQGAVLGVGQSLASIAQMIGPVIAGFLIERSMLKTYGLVAAGFAFVGLTFMFRSRGRLHEQAGHSAQERLAPGSEGAAG